MAIAMPVERIPITDDYDWLGARPQFVNASEMATVCGEASYGSLAELYAEKKGLRPPLIDSGVLRRGRWGEAAVFQALADTYPDWNIRRAKVHCIDRDRRIAATPDGFAEAPSRAGLGLIETKVVARGVFRAKWLDNPDGSIDGPASVPTNFRIQVTATRLLNPQCQWAVIAVLINGEFDWQFQLFDVEQDPALEDRILYRAHQFLHDYLDPGIMPPFDPQRDEALVKLLYPKDDGSEIDLTTDNRAQIAAEELVETKAAISRMEKQEAALKTELGAKLGPHTFGRLADGRRLSWKMQHRKGYVAEPSDFRVLRILKAKDDEAA
jgi:predicted phage-related endonuclease